MNKALIGWTLLETRWRFIVGLILMSLSAIGTVLSYPGIVEMLPAVPDIDAETRLGRALDEALTLTATFRGYVWSQLFSQNLTEMTILFAALLGTGAQFLPGTGRSTHFILSLPVTRGTLLAFRSGVGLAELLVITLVPALLVSVTAPAIAEQYSFGSALVHGFSLFLGGTVFFALATWLSTVYEDPWRPLLITCGVAFVIGMVFVLTEMPSQLSILNARAFFESGLLPWSSWALALVLSSGLLYAAYATLKRQDF